MKVRPLGDKIIVKRAESQRIFVDFWGDAANTPRRQQHLL